MRLVERNPAVLRYVHALPEREKPTLDDRRGVPALRQRQVQTVNLTGLGARFSGVLF